MKDRIPEYFIRLQHCGFDYASHSLLMWLYRHPFLRQKLAVFKAGSVNRGAIRFFARDIFGEELCLYYLKDSPQRLVEVLVWKFYKQNPSPTARQRAAFTTLLHDHNLHWYGCSDSKRGNHHKLAEVA